jgi:hypothetical protein
MALPWSGRKALASVILAFVFAFALVNSLRMASILGADQTMGRADRQTVGVQTSSRQLTDARTARDKACRAGQGKSKACKDVERDVAKQEHAQTQATTTVASAAKPENPDFSALVTWVSRGSIAPGANDFAMLWLLFRTLLPQIGGFILMVARR